MSHPRTIKPIVVYTDPAWAVTCDGRIDPARAGIEREVFGDAIDLKFGPWDGRRFIIEGRELHDAVSGAQAVVIYRCVVTPELLAVVEPTVRVIARQGVGYDNLNAPLLQRHGIHGFHVPDYCVDEVAAHTMGLMLSLHRHICQQNDHLKRGRWDIFHGGVPRRLMHLTAGIIGLGRIGLTTSQRLQGFVGRVVAFDPYVQEDLMIAHRVTKAASLEALLGESDIVLLHCLLNDETRYIIRSETLAHMKPGALLVNTARGQLVDSQAVYDALLGARLGGYAVDVFSPEDPNENEVNRRLVQLDTVVATCHRAFLSQESEESLRRRVACEVLHVLQTGQAPRFGNLTPGVGAKGVGC